MVKMIDIGTMHSSEAAKQHLTEELDVK